MLSHGSALPLWMPIFLLVLLILASVWGMPLMLNKEALEQIFHHEEAPKPEQCPAELNPAVKAFLAWPNEQAKPDQAVLKKETKTEQIFDQVGLLKDPVEQPPDSPILEIELQMPAKEEKVLNQNKELKAQEAGKEEIGQVPDSEMLAKVKAN